MDQLDGARVLLVDDSALARADLLRKMDGAGAEVTAVDSARAALDALAEKAFDVLVCDLCLPSTDGYALIKAIRRGRGPNRAIAAVAITGEADEEARRKALASGFDDFLPKLVSALLVPTVARLREPR